MVIIVSTDGKSIEFFEDYNGLFEYLSGTEHAKFIAVNQNVKDRDWNFTVYSPQQAAILYTDFKDSWEAIKEAFEERISLVEICSGDYKRPLYIAQTPNVDMDYLKKKWCVDYCVYHNLVVREF